MSSKGRYVAIGAGPAADLITMRGYNALKSADIILYDKLIDTSVLDGINAEKVSVGKTAYNSYVSQEQINELLHDELLKGKAVIRLKGGDSLLFSRVAEELEVARSCGAEIEIIPGVTAASGAMARAQIPLTDRFLASGAVFITGHGKVSNPENPLPEHDWALLASGKLTIVIYMGVKHIALIAQKLIDEGMDGATPILMASKVEQADEKLCFSSIKEVAASGCDVENPTIFVIGNVLKDGK